MTDEQTPKRRRLDADAASIIRLLPSLGKLMMIGKANGATHERIGVIENVSTEDGWLRCSGENHASSVDPSLVAQVIFDTSSLMQGQVYPRLDFQDASENTLFAVVGFEGADPFEAGLADLPSSVLPEKPAAVRETRPDVAEADPGAVPLKSALAAGTPITIGFESRGFRQSWTGVVEKVSPGMGFINVMRGDFHLHLLGGTVGNWRRDESAEGLRMAALDAEGKETGLFLQAELPATLTATGPAA